MSETAGKKAPLIEALLAIEALEAKLEAAERRRHEPIAIVGMGCRLPGGVTGPDSYWRFLAEGGDGVREMPTGRWDVDAYFDADPEAPGKAYTRRGGFLEDVDLFDPQFFGIAPREAADLDPQQRLLLEVAWESLENAGIAPDSLRGSQTGVFVTVMTNDYLRAQQPVEVPDLLSAYTATGTGLSFPAGRLSYTLGLHGPSMMVATACSASLVTVHLACQSLRAGECELALAGGVNLILAPDYGVILSRLKALAPDGRSKAFDAGADGYGRGEGCGLVVLKTLSKAQADSDRILAVIRGSAVNHDGPSGGLTVPSGPAQERLLRQALASAGLAPGDVAWVEAHGTGTRLGDPIEVRALASVLGNDRPVDEPLQVTSVKSSIGHLESAAGIAALIKVVLGLRHGEVPPQTGVRQLNPLIPWDEIPVRVPLERTPWPVSSRPSGSGERRRVAGVSAFGLSGINAHVLLEEAPPAPAVPAEAERPVQLLRLTARSPESLRALAGRYQQRFAELAHGEAPGTAASTLADVCHCANTGRAHFPHRLAVVAASCHEVAEVLEGFADGEESSALVRGTVPAGGRPKLAFLFSGQGSQYAGMGRQLYQTEAVFRGVLDRCEEVAAPLLGRSLLGLLFPQAGEDDDRPELAETQYTQPALFALQMALAELWRSWGVTPSAVLGHSVGEIAAACTAGYFGLEDGLRFTIRRGQLMQALPRGGAMASVTLSDRDAEAAIAGFPDRLAVAALNGPQSSVLSGEREALEEVLARLEADGVSVRRLEVSHAFHSPLVEPMLRDLEEAARQLQVGEPTLELFSNLTGERASAPQIAALEYWSRHARQPVLFGDSMHALASRGFNAFVEIGPGTTLLGMARKGLAGDETGEAGESREEPLWLPSLRHGREDLRQILASLGALYTHGFAVDFQCLGQRADGLRRRPVPLPTYPFERRRYWFAPRPRRGAARASAPGAHPLLVRRLRLPLVPQTIFESELDSATQPWLADHRLYEHAVVPGAAYLSAMLALTQRDGRTVQHVRFPQALVVDGDNPSGPVTVQVVLDPQEAGRTGVRVLSLRPRPEDASQAEPAGEAFTLHATAQLVSQGEARPSPAAVDLDALRTRLGNAVDIEDFYRRSEQRGLHLGPSFRRLANLRVRLGEEGQALAELVTEGPEELTAGFPLRGDHLHPGLLDACFQVLFDLVPEGGALWVPLGIESLEVFGSPAQAAFVHGTLRFDSDEGGQARATSELRLLGAAGEVLAQMSGITARPMERAALLRALGQGVGDWLYVPSWRRRDASPDTAPPDQRWLLLGGPAEAEPLAQALRKAGQQVVALASSDPAALRELLAESEEAWRGVVDLGGLLPATDDDPPAAQEALLGGALRRLQTLAEARPAGARLWWLTRGAVAVEDRETESEDVQAVALDLNQATLWGLGRTAARELGDLWGGLVDLDPAGEDRWELLVRHLLAADGEDQAALRGAHRLVARLSRLPRVARVETGADSLFDPHASYLLTGGLGALGLETAGWMLERGARNLVLVGRSEPRAAVYPRLDALRKKAWRVEVVTADVARAEDAERLLARAAELGPVKGIVHAAGVLDDGVIPQQSWQRFAGVLAPKVAGAWNLHRASRQLDLDFFVLYSSAASILGSAGQSGYAAANAFLDQLAAERRRQGLPALSIAWGPWGADGMAAEEGLERRLAAQGMGLLSVDRGLEALERLMVADQGPGLKTAQVGVLPIDWEVFLARDASRFFAEVAPRHPGDALTAAPAGPPELVAKLEGAVQGERVRRVRAFISQAARTILGLDQGSPPIDPRQPFIELGFDSLMTLELTNRLSAAMGQVLPANLLFDFPNVAALAEHLTTLLAPATEPGRAAQDATTRPVADPAPAAGAAADIPSELDRALAALAELSDEEAEALLAAEGNDTP